ncbi:MAG: serine/threonine-protein kinase, partial [Pseudomonadota bacterium]
LSRKMIEKGIILSQRYELLNFIGKGGMSEVWKARHIHLDKNVAIKLLSKDLLHKKEFVARFKQEARIASKLVHENICSVSDFGFTQENVPYLVMEYLYGESLSSIVKRLERLPLGAALSIVRQALSGLTAAHKIGVVHRDIKPGNIFITKEKSGARIPKVLDFGISKMLHSGKKDLGLTSTGTLLGTAFYLSPEQIMESKGVDHRTDLYAMGTVLFKLVTGHVPFMGENFGEVAVKVVNDPLIDPRKYVQGMHGGVVKIIKKAMTKDSRNRYQSAEEMLSDIDRLMEEFQGETIEALYKPGMESMLLKLAPKKVSRFSKKAKIAAAGVSLFILLGIGTLILLGMNNFGKSEARSKDESNQPAEPAEPEKDNTETAGRADPEPAKPAKVKIRLTSAPPGVRFRVGDEEYGGELIQVDKSSTAMSITIFAKGFKSKDVTLVPNEDVEIDATLEPESGASTDDTALAQKKGTGKPKGTSGVKKGTKKTGSGGKKGDGLGFVRDFPGLE